MPATWKSFIITIAVTGTAGHAAAGDCRLRYSRAGRPVDVDC
jgi:hypothetical protein